jgi:tRNA(Arg) A34 adenosine deaminase TadA
LTDENLMRLAIDQAWRGVKSGNGEVGVVVTCDGEIVHRGFNRINASDDVTGHAEIDALRAVSKKLDSLDLSRCALYCTLEPCGMCTCAAVWANLGRIVFGAPRAQVPARYFELDGLTIEDILRSARNRVAVTGGVLSDQCLELYRER